MVLVSFELNESQYMYVELCTGELFFCPSFLSQCYSAMSKLCITRSKQTTLDKLKVAKVVKPTFRCQKYYRIGIPVIQCYVFWRFNCQFNIYGSAKAYL